MQTSIDIYIHISIDTNTQIPTHTTHRIIHKYLYSLWCPLLGKCRRWHSPSCTGRWYAWPSCCGSSICTL